MIIRVLAGESDSLLDDHWAARRKVARSIQSLSDKTYKDRLFED